MTGARSAVGREIADAAGVEAALLLLQLVDDLHRADLRRARVRAGGEAGGERVEGTMGGVALAAAPEQAGTMPLAGGFWGDGVTSKLDYVVRIEAEG